LTSHLVSTVRTGPLAITSTSWSVNKLKPSLPFRCSRLNPALSYPNFCSMVKTYLGPDDFQPALLLWSKWATPVLWIAARASSLASLTLSWSLKSTLYTAAIAASFRQRSGHVTLLPYTVLLEALSVSTPHPVPDSSSHVCLSPSLEGLLATPRCSPGHRSTCALSFLLSGTGLSPDSLSPLWGLFGHCLLRGAVPGMLLKLTLPLSPFSCFILGPCTQPSDHLVTCV
jgi:hypothetical protein